MSNYSDRTTGGIFSTKLLGRKEANEEELLNNFVNSSISLGLKSWKRKWIARFHDVQQQCSCGLASDSINKLPHLKRVTAPQKHVVKANHGSICQIQEHISGNDE